MPRDSVVLESFRSDIYCKPVSSGPESNREPFASQHLIPRTLGYSATDKRNEKKLTISSIANFVIELFISSMVWAEQSVVFQYISADTANVYLLLVQFRNSVNEVKIMSIYIKIYMRFLLRSL